MGPSTSALRRAHAVLLYIAQNSERTTLSEIAEDLDIPPSTTHRVLVQLVDEDLVVATSGGHYGLGWKALQLARRIWNAASDEQLALPLMTELSQITGETVTLNKYLPSEGFCVCVAVAETSHSLSFALNIGDVRYLNMGAGGKSILAGLQPEEADAVIARHGLPAATNQTVIDQERLKADVTQIRKNGYAISLGESVSGAIGYAMPIFYRGSMVFGSMTITAPRIRFRQDWEPAWLSGLARKAHALSELLGASPETLSTFYSTQHEDIEVS